MEELIREKLKVLKSIEPAAEFLSRSRAMILLSPRPVPSGRGLRRQLSEGFRFAGALALASVLLIVLVGGTHSPSSHLSSFNTTTLSGEAAQVSSDFQIHLDEANYYGQSAARVASALDEISKSPKAN